MDKERRVGTVSRGIRLPIIRQGDNLAEIVADSVLAAAESEGFEMRDRDVIAITESIVAVDKVEVLSVCTHTWVGMKAGKHRVAIPLSQNVQRCYNSDRDCE